MTDATFRPAVQSPLAPAVGFHAPRLPLQLGTRGSPLALTQTRLFLDLLQSVCPVMRQLDAFAITPIRTTGDATQATGERLADIGGKGLFAKEIHQALLERRIDFAVHSAKDLDTVLPAGIVIACTLPREDPRDALILHDRAHAAADGTPFDAIPRGATIGSSSVRRQAQLLHHRPDLKIETIRGNVHTRLEKVRSGACAGSFLALAGMRRLGLGHQADVLLDPQFMVPSACQGIVAITVREGDEEIRELLASITNPDAHGQLLAEREVLAALDGSCLTPVGAHAELLGGGEVRLTGLVASEDGGFLLRRSVLCALTDGPRAGRELGRSLRQDSPASLFAS
jgi:hydroxymethylbilane synthase